jgi:hypothetical protein
VPLQVRLASQIVARPLPSRQQGWPGAPQLTQPSLQTWLLTQPWQGTPSTPQTCWLSASSQPPMSQQPSRHEVGEQLQVVPAQARPLLQPASAQQGSLWPPHATQEALSQASKVVQRLQAPPPEPQASAVVPLSQPLRSQQPRPQLDDVQKQVPPAQLRPALQLTLPPGPLQQASPMPPQQAPAWQSSGLGQTLHAPPPSGPQAEGAVPSSQPS